MQAYEIDPELYWERLRAVGRDGYDMMEAVAPLGWTALASWKGRLIGE